MLEDDFNDVLGKAICGMGAAQDQLGVASSQLKALLSGQMNEEHIRKVAPLINLDPEKLIHLEHYAPKVSIPPNLHTFVSEFGHLGVNAFVLETSHHFLIFDTGTNATECLRFLAHNPNKECHLYITHNHPDHIADLNKFKQTTIHKPQDLQNSSKYYDEYTITGLNVAGHATPATAYLIEDETLPTPLCIVGDAIFAGSIGGCQNKHAYQTALSNISENILTLPENTVLCPGHGPLTTVQQELENNPFF